MKLIGLGILFFDLPGRKWMYFIEVRFDGTLDRYKACLVAQGFKQNYVINCEETFALIEKMITVRTLLCVAAFRNWPSWHTDVKNPLLHGDLN